MKTDALHKAKEKKREPVEVLKPGEHNEYWDKLLSWRDNQDSRWKTLPYVTRYSAWLYENNLNKRRHEG
jgi:hypothetical protein